MTVERTAAVPPSGPLTLSGSAGRTRYAAQGVAGGSAGSLGLDWGERYPDRSHRARQNCTSCQAMS